MKTTSNAARIMTRKSFSKLLRALIEEGYELIGPTVREGVVVFDQIDGIEDLPGGIEDVQGRGHYRLEGLRARDDGRLFGFVSGPDSAKRWLFPPREVVATIRRSEKHLEFDEPSEAPRYAFVGLRACDLRAVAIQDRVFSAGPSVNASYVRRRENAFFIGVNCARPGENCFCTSMGSGPRCTQGYDLVLTELDVGFMVEAGSANGSRLLAGVPTRRATKEEKSEADSIPEETSRRMAKSVETEGLPTLLKQSRESSRWEEIAQLCLACGNCTAVCPTCFCHDIVDGVDLTGTHADRTREWASCFSLDFSRAMGSHLRASVGARYRQWITHKFGSWVDQFGESGCVGCGRCITWCPAGIDITEQLALLGGNGAGNEGESGT